MDHRQTPTIIGGVIAVCHEYNGEKEFFSLRRLFPMQDSIVTKMFVAFAVLVVSMQFSSDFFNDAFARPKQDRIASQFAQPKPEFSAVPIWWEMWRPKRRRYKHREWRERKGCFGEMVQMDTSEHDWFEGRGEKAYLILMIDDATSRIYARFYATDSTKTNMDLLKRYFRRYGRPKAIYADKASHFKTTRATTVSAKPISSFEI